MASATPTPPARTLENLECARFLSPSSATAGTDVNLTRIPAKETAPEATAPLPGETIIMTTTDEARKTAESLAARATDSENPGRDRKTEEKPTSCKPQGCHESSQTPQPNAHQHNGE